MSAVTARLIEIRARVAAGGITPGNETRCIAARATEFVKDPAAAEHLTVELETLLDYHGLLAAMDGSEPGLCDLALEILDEIEAASR